MSQNQRPNGGRVELRCPGCGKFLAEVKGYGRVVCKDCASELTYRSKEERNTATGSIRVLTAS